MKKKTPRLQVNKKVLSKGPFIAKYLFMISLVYFFSRDVFWNTNLKLLDVISNLHYSRFVIKRKRKAKLSRTFPCNPMITSRFIREAKQRQITNQKKREKNYN